MFPSHIGPRDSELTWPQKYAEPLLSKVGWAYYASAGDDEISQHSPEPFMTERDFSDL